MYVHNCSREFSRYYLWNAPCHNSIIFLRKQDFCLRNSIGLHIFVFHHVLTLNLSSFRLCECGNRKRGVSQRYSKSSVDCAERVSERRVMSRECCIMFITHGGSHKLVSHGTRICPTKRRTCLRAIGRVSRALYHARNARRKSQACVAVLETVGLSVERVSERFQD